ncbi:hypothetical protein Avbf_09481 [Armadillidium vulgare]|nr:hypothetical protein Avbf_09481 [Armadillidium vulgare]
MEELEARLITRGTETKESLQKRISSARREMEYGEKARKFSFKEIVQRSLERKERKTCLMDAHAVEIRIKNDMGRADSYIESLLRTQKIKYDESIVFNYVSDNCEGYEESFEIENLKSLTKSEMVFHSNFIFVNDLLETDDASLEEEEEITTGISEKEAEEEGSEEKAEAEAEAAAEEEEVMEIDISLAVRTKKTSQTRISQPPPLQIHQQEHQQQQEQ